MCSKYFKAMNKEHNKLFHYTTIIIKASQNILFHSQTQRVHRWFLSENFFYKASCLPYKQDIANPLLALSGVVVVGSTYGMVDCIHRKEASCCHCPSCDRFYISKQKQFNHN